MQVKENKLKRLLFKKNILFKIKYFNNVNYSPQVYAENSFLQNHNYRKMF